MSSQRRLIVSAVAGAGLALSLGLGSRRPIPKRRRRRHPRAAGTPVCSRPAAAPAGTPTVPAGRPPEHQAPSYAYVWTGFPASSPAAQRGPGNNLLNEALTLRARGFPQAGRPGGGANRAGQRPKRIADRRAAATIAHQHQLQSEAGSGSAQNQPDLGVSVNQDAGLRATR